MRRIASWRTVKLVVRGRLVVPLDREREGDGGDPSGRLSSFK